MLRVLENDDEKAFEELVLRYRKSAVKFAVRYSGDYYIAEDLVQDTFAIIYVKRNSFNGDYRFKSYLFKILRNLCIDYLRKKSKITEQEFYENITSEKNSPEMIAINKESHIWIHKKFSFLNEQYQTALYLLEFEEMSYKQIAKIMGLNLGQLKMLIYRARKKLKSLIGKELNS